MGIMTKLIIVCGLPYCGKSTLSENISKSLHLPLFSVDPIMSAILESGYNNRDKAGLASYKVAAKLAEEHLKLGVSVIVDSVSGPNEFKNVWRDLAKKYNVKLIIIECSCKDEALHRQRLENRNRVLHGVPELRWDEMKKWRDEYVPWTEELLSLDASNSREENSKKALDYIQQ